MATPASAARAGYDPTHRPWYRQALPERGSMVCGEPFLDTRSPILELACSVALYSSAGEFLGVADVELPLKAGVARLLDAPDLPQARALLLNDRGQVLVEVERTVQSPGAGSLCISIRMRPLSRRRGSAGRDCRSVSTGNAGLGPPHLPAGAEVDLRDRALCMGAKGPGCGWEGRAATPAVTPVSQRSDSPSTP